MIYDLYQEGKQPCQNFHPQDDLGMDMGNEHECFRCGGIVSFCTNCCRDHHRHGWDRCQKKESQEA